ncbi:putative disease resistance RPP13-like protein 1 [Vicia villosa]|uniref:putative disease resistance RPP13-like protein 1 n=1 Tax=Vicia villosa TaxID=3911 RepID=UPI00273AEA79|nr:putative disease resistance RPP13-like protein 1 [Vicia villosa]XP_058721848.1 putative disease resistance RPP13-like protein 1 [Vicia villosa]XP_058721849.1 putative disease resistance RPP13-like protein 1 [Vicia villosa]XP_058721850.1 putative disease resistance RPP13-like protein 1 [Vicia villosa]XP_058721851.1 putative disease resistance RPP13-like protein 1 [Vicia villosa]XP_058721852.1 putative disease resistance RPP13-like protein 1 [Vicia villosa]
MAELVAGAFLSSFFQVIFDRLASSNFTDYFRRGKLDKLVEELESTLESINQVLDDAEIKQYQIPNVKKWLGDVKHAMYEADQLLDEIATDAPLKKIRAESQPTTSRNNYFGYVSSFINPFESRVKELLKNLKHLAEQKDVLELKNGSLARNEVGVSSKPLERPQTSYLVDASQIYGRDDEKDEMIKFLLSNNGSDNQTPVSSIVGLGGMGKTTFAKLVYNDSRIENHFELKAWVYVSESFDVVGLTKAILKSFHSPADDESILNLLQQRLQRVLTGKKYLLVLDDIWNGNADCWEQLLLPFNHGSFGSKIIATTRDKDVAHVLNSTKIFELQQLEKKDCWSLFVTHAFHGKNVCDNPNLELIGKKILEKCGGLPLAVKTMGQLLRKKFSQHEWMKILETDLWRLSEGDNNINPVLRLSYHNLPSNHKRCFAYCSIFPKGYHFEKCELIRIWMAEGLLKCCRTEKSEEELGNEIFGDLESISFFQQSAYYYSTMHDLVNDLADSVLGEFCMRINEAKVEGIPGRTRHIRWSLQSNFVDKLLEPICELKGLRSLLLEDHFGISISRNVQRDMFSRLKYLRMLSLYYCGISELVDEISNLKLLRYLDLSRNRISRLPDTICMLYNLQTLLLNGCNELTELPSNFYKLINLRHLELPYSIMKMPKNIGSLSNLQTLNFFTVEEQNGSDLKELEKLNHLHGTIYIEGLGKVIDPTDVTTRSLKDKMYLEEIEMIFNGGREDMDGSIVESNVSVLETLQPNSNLKKLTIRMYRGNSFSNWLSGCHLLKMLYISDCHGIKIIGKELSSNNFNSLEILIFENMDNLEEWLCIDGFPLLKELYIINCPKLKRVSLPQHLPSLEILEISGCKMLAVSIPICDNIEELKIKRCGRILINELSSSLKRFSLRENQYIEFPMVHLINNPNLELLKLDFKDFVECPSLDLCCYNSLWEFSITGWKSSSLPFSPHLFTLLNALGLSNCPELECFPMGGFPSNLIDLKIVNCPKLKASREDWRCLHHKSKVYIIIIHNCASLEHLPEEWGSIFDLEIEDCPLLKEKYQKEGGDRWHTISHIPEVIIDGSYQTSFISEEEMSDCDSDESM